MVGCQVPLDLLPYDYYGKYENNPENKKSVGVISVIGLRVGKPQHGSISPTTWCLLAACCLLLATYYWRQVPASPSRRYCSLCRQSTPPCANTTRRSHTSSPSQPCVRNPLPPGLSSIVSPPTKLDGDASGPSHACLASRDRPGRVRGEGSACCYLQ